LVCLLLRRSDKGEPEEKGELTMRSRRAHSIHICAVIRMSGRCKRTICNALRIKPKPILLRIILACRQRPRNDFGLVAVAKTLHVLVGIVGARGLGALEIGVVEDFLGVGSRKARHDYVAVAVCVVCFLVCHDCLLEVLCKVKLSHQVS
jgi:hypothetical protein